MTRAQGALSGNGVVRGVIFGAKAYISSAPRLSPKDVELM